jgi:uncharacterized membrane protein
MHSFKITTEMLVLNIWLYYPLCVSLIVGVYFPALWLIVGVICAVVLVLAIIAVAGIAYATHRSKRIHPHSDTETIYTESESGTYTRPTTASHIKLEQV